jgi:transcriptional regulator with XRE-family HTH domain
MPQGETLWTAREEFGWTQSEAAAEVGVALRTWQFWEAEQRAAPEMLYRLLELQREVRRLKGEPFSWDRFNEEQAQRSQALLLKPERAPYGSTDAS